MLLGLHIEIWVVLGFYFAGMLALGWWSKRQAQDREGYLVGGRQFGVPMMVMHAFGAGTNPTDTAGTISKTVAGGASGIWVSWMWMFGTPFYWLIAPVVRRMRCLTLADFYRERFGRAAAVLYTLVASVGMTIFFGGVLLATARTVQGMMGQTTVHAAGAIDWWFYGILLVTTVVFVIYGFWGGIVAAIRTDMVQGLMIIVLSFLAIPAALRMAEVGGLDGMRATLAAKDAGYLKLFHPAHFSLGAVILLCINAPLTALALPHLMSVTSSGRTEWEGRMGFAGGNLLKRVCTIGWSVLGLCWLAYLIRTGQDVRPDAAFGDSIRHLLSPVLQGLMLACVMAASMSSGDAVQVTVAGLFTQSLYREYIRPDADERQLMRFTRWTGVAIIGVSLLFAMLMQSSLVKSVIMYFNILAMVGISTALGILWRRMNQAGVFASTIAATVVFLATRLIPGCPMAARFGLPVLVGMVAGVIGSLVTQPPDAARIARFFTRIYVPIGQEDKLELSLDEVVPPAERLCTAGGLFLVKPSRQSWVGFVITLAICLACVGAMLVILR